MQGFRFQLYVLLGLSFIVGGVSNLIKGMYGLGGLPFGLAIGTYFYAFESVDFNDFPYVLFAGRGMDVAQYIVETKAAWSVAMGMTLGAFAFYVLIFWIIKGKKKAAN